MDLGAMGIKGYSVFLKASPSDCLVSLSGHSLGESYPSAEMQLVHSGLSKIGLPCEVILWLQVTKDNYLS